MTPKRFGVVPGQRTSIGRRAGAKVVYSVSEAGTARFTVRRRGRRGKVLGSFRYGAVRGRNALRFTGQLPRRALAPGRYFLVVRVVDLVGDRSRAKRIRFQIRS